MFCEKVFCSLIFSFKHHLGTNALFWTQMSLRVCKLKKRSRKLWEFAKLKKRSRKEFSEKEKRNFDAEEKNSLRKRQEFLKEKRSKEFFTFILGFWRISSLVLQNVKKRKEKNLRDLTCEISVRKEIITTHWMFLSTCVWQYVKSVCAMFVCMFVACF